MLIPKSFIFFIILFVYSMGWTQNNDTIFENQLYVKLNHYNISESSWKSVENSPNNINSSVFPFGGFLDSIGLINIKQPFAKKNAEKLYLTFLLEFTDKKHDLNKIIKDLTNLVRLIILNQSLKILKTTSRTILAIVVAGI